MKRERVRKLNGWTKFDIIVIIVAVLICAITLYPMIYVVACSFSDPVSVMGGLVVLWPVGFSTQAYTVMMQNLDFLRSILNSVGYVIAGCILMLITTILMAYPLTRPNLMARPLVNYFLLIPMYFSGGMIPSYLVVTKLGLYNTPWALILPGCYGIWNIILCRTFMAGIPGELTEAALIDGGSQFQILRKVILPLSKPVLAVIMIYTIVGVWNSWFGAAIYTTNEEIQPVQLYMRNIITRTSFASEMENLIAGLTPELQQKYRDMAMSARQMQYAMIVITTLPIIAVYPMFQKHFTKGIMLGSLKG